MLCGACVDPPPNGKPLFSHGRVQPSVGAIAPVVRFVPASFVRLRLEAAMSRSADAVPDSVLPPDAESITRQALAAEDPPEEPRGVYYLDARELRFQRRMTVVLTVGPLLGVALAMAALWGWGASAVDLGLFVAFYAVTGLGVTAGYHRLFTHRSFEATRAVRAVLAVAGSLAIQGSLIEWVAIHRRHHAYADAYGDPHSPHLGQATGLRGVLAGLWHAHVGWFWQRQRTDVTRWAPDLLADPMLARIDRAFPVLIVVSFVAPPALGLALTGSLWGAVTAFLWASLVRVFLLHHVTWSINSICHFFGDRPFPTRDEATNNWPLSLLSLGESWHNNHHAFPTSARHGLLRGQLDVTYRTIATLRWLRLVRNVRLPSAHKVAAKGAGASRRLARQ
jgi:stearoyl-CoA desaturase (delta-9 desaturase)